MLAFLPGGIGPMEMMIFGVIALLLFGKRLPEVARSLGKGIVEFKRGIKGVEDEFRGATSVRNDPPSRRRPEPVHDDHPEWTAPRFEPPTSEPTAATSEHKSE